MVIQYKLTKKKYRLHGIDAPEIDQDCIIDKKKYKCGLESKLFLESLIINKQVNCKKKILIDIIELLQFALSMI